MSEHHDLDARLGALLGAASPEDPAREAHARTAALDALPTGRRWRRRVLRAAVPALGFAALGTVLVLAVPRGQTPSATTPSPADEPLSVLRTPQGPEDHLPAWVADDPAVVANAVDPASVRLAQTSAGRLFFVAHGRASRRDDGLRPTGSRTICLIAATRRVPGAGFRPGRPGSVSCALEDSFAWGNVVSGLVGSYRTVTTASGRFRQVDTLVLLAVVPDGYDTIHTDRQTVRVTGNLARATFSVVPRRAPTPYLTGPRGRRAVFASTGTGQNSGMAWASSAAFGRGRPFDRPLEPRTMDLTISRVRPWVTRIAVAGRTVVVRRRDVLLRNVPVPVAGTVVVTATGGGRTERTAIPAGGYAVGYGQTQLTPYRRR